MSSSWLSTLAEWIRFLQHRKRWWLAPILLVLATISFFIVLSDSSVVMHLIYTLF